MAVPLTAREPVSFTPPSIPERLKGEADGVHKFQIFVRVPTMMERDSYQSALVRAGVQVYTKQQIRDLCLAGVQEIYPADMVDEKQALLRELWTLQDDETEARGLELEILREEHEKAAATGKPVDIETVKKRYAEIEPDVVMDSKRRIDATALSQEVIAKFKPLSEVVAGLADQDAKRAWMNAQIYVIGWSGLEHEPDKPGTAGLKQHEVEYLRSQIGSTAFTELSDFITSIMVIDEEEEKNLASLLASMSAPIGSTQSASTESSDDGSSTVEPSTTIPESGSAKTTGSSSSSSTRSKTRTAPSKGGRTAKRSSTSRSS